MIPETLIAIRTALQAAGWTSDTTALTRATVYHGQHENWQFLIVQTDDGAVDGTATNTGQGAIVRLPPDIAKEAAAHATRRRL